MKFKDPITGEYKTLHLKTGDTLPVGTIVSFEGDEIPEGYEEVIGEEARVVISPTEPTTGEEVWIDDTNKKIYTKKDNGGYKEFYKGINVIYAQNATGYTTTSTSAEIVPLTQVEKIGDRLSMSEDGGIKIGKGVNYVKASGQINYSSVTSDQTRVASYIYRNESNMSLSSIRSSGDSSEQCVVNSPTLIHVEEGDIIYLKARTRGAAGGVTAASSRTTYLYVEVID